MTVYDRIKNRRLELGMSQADLANKLGYKSRSAINKIENGLRDISQSKLSQFAEALETTPTFLMGWDDEKEPSNLGAIITGKTRMIPLYESASAGFGAYADDHIIDYIPLVIDNDEEANNTICIKVVGDSMYPKIEEDDIIVVRKQTSVDSGSVGVFIIDNDEALVKKVKYVTGEDWLDLISFNPEYKTKHFEGADVERVQTFGLVKQVIKTL